MHMRFTSTDSRFKAWQLAAFFVPFLIPITEAVRKLGLLGLLDPRHPFWMVLIYALGGLWLLVFTIGLVRAFPTWTLPATGMVLFLIGFIIKLMVQALLVSVASFPGSITWPDPLPVRIGLMLVREMLFLAPMLLILALILKAAPPFQERVRKDVSLLSILVFGMAILLPILYDEYQGRGIYELAGVLVLVAGAVLYLVIHSNRLRILVLALVVVLSSCILSFGLYRIFPDQYFAQDVAPFRIWESIQPLLEIPSLLVLLLLPLFLPGVPILRGIFQGNSGSRISTG